MLKRAIILILLLISSIVIVGCNTTTTTTMQTTTQTSTTNEITTTELLYDIVLNTMGGTLVESLSLPEGSYINLPYVEKEGYSFDDWYYDEDLTIKYTTIPMPANNIILYAKWSINQYSISYYTLESKLNVGETILMTSFSDSHSSAITSEGRLFTWGDNYKGKLGNGLTSNQYIPIDITSGFGLNIGETLEYVSLGGYHSSAITTDGRVFTWGNNSSGQLGDGTLIDKFTPTDITDQFSLNQGEEITSVSLGGKHSAAITSEGRLFTWGYNNYGQLGDLTTLNKNVPTDITSQFNLASGEKILSVSLGDFHSSAVTSNGRIFTWGYNFVGQLGNGNEFNKSIPTEITSEFGLDIGETILSVILGEEYSSAITSNGRLFTWGNNVLGQLGDDTITNKNTPIDITPHFSLSTGEIITNVSLGGDHSAAITSNGRLFTWGYNFSSQLGDGSRNNKHKPNEITSQFNLDAGENITSISLGKVSSSAVTSTGRTFTWGFNGVGQLGDGTITNIDTPYNLLFNDKLYIISETYDYNVDIYEYIPTREGYTFHGWFVNESFTEAFVFDSMPAEDIILYAKWISD